VQFERFVASPTYSSRSLQLLGTGVYGMEIHFLEIKFYDIAVYAEAGTVEGHLQSWKGHPRDALLAEGSGFFADVCNGQFLLICRTFHIVLLASYIAPGNDMLDLYGSE
jgi:hypothetical protein